MKDENNMNLNAKSQEGDTSHLPSVTEVDSLVQYVEVGEFTLGRNVRNNFWLENGKGEGMEVSEEMIEKLLGDFFKKHF